MNIIILSDRLGAARALRLSTPWVVLGLVLVLAMPAVAAWITWRLVATPAVPVAQGVDYEQMWQQALSESEVQAPTDESKVQLARMTEQLGRLQTRLTRLDALGERLTELANLSDGEFNFESDPGMGGPELRKNLDLNHQAPDVQSIIDELVERVDNRTQQLRLIEQLMLNRQSDANASLDFIPVGEGYISSNFGRRTDPISGRMSMHTGIDFAAPSGTAIHAVGAGVVTFAGRKGAYGNTVEITHGNGYRTRYAHAKELKVSKGEVVKKGQTIANVGSTGRSTGPHLHLEVFRNGMAVNPARHIALNK